MRGPVPIRNMNILANPSPLPCAHSRLPTPDSPAQASKTADPSRSIRPTYRSSDVVCSWWRKQKRPKRARSSDVEKRTRGTNKDRGEADKILWVLARNANLHQESFVGTLRNEEQKPHVMRMKENNAMLSENIHPDGTRRTCIVSICVRMNISTADGLH